MLLEDTLNRIVPPGGEAAARAKERWDSLAKPLGSLGLLEEAVIRIAAMTDDPDYFPEKCALAVMCADNGVVAQGVTQTDSSVTAPMAPRITPGVNAFHSGSRHIHIPRANNTAPMVPKIIAAKLLFFISISPSFCFS